MDSGRDVVLPCAAAASLKHAFEEVMYNRELALFMFDHCTIHSFFIV